jgi:hypothetical protein
VAVGVWVDVGVPVAVEVGGIGVIEGVRVFVGTGVAEAPPGVWVGCGVLVRLGVELGSGVLVLVGMSVGELVGVLEGVLVRVGVLV